MRRQCVLCGCDCLTGLKIGGRMLCYGCETALVAQPGGTSAPRELLLFHEGYDKALPHEGSRARVYQDSPAGESGSGVGVMNTSKWNQSSSG